MRSMTGFASKTKTIHVDGAAVDVTVHVKSVNARFFETNCRLPQALFNLETAIIKLLKKELYRGHLFLNVNVADQSAFKGDIVASLSLAKNYADAARAMQKETHTAGELTISDLIALPHIFSVKEHAIDEKVKKQLFEVMQDAAHALITEQEKEGAALKKDIHARATIIAQKTEQIEQLHEAFMKRRKKEILDEIQGYTDSDDIIESRKAGLYYILDKIDITEEIVRLKSHLQHLQDLLKSPQIEKGKRLDFTLQELGREINTIAAKCSDAQMGSLAIDVKVEIEKMREQAQNIV